MPRKPTDTYDYIDQYVGNRLKQRRKFLKMSQGALAQLLVLSYQQVQKYENGSSSISASRLAHIAQLLKVPVSYFYDGLVLEESSSGGVSSTIKKKRTQRFEILLIEDSVEDALLFQEALKVQHRETGLNVISRADEAIDKLHNLQTHGLPRPDIILLDISMPKLSGLELLKILRRDEDLCSIPIIMLTASINFSDMEEGYANYAAGYLLKESSLEGLSEQLRVVIEYWAETVKLPTM